MRTAQRVCLALALFGCSSEQSPTQPETTADAAPRSASASAAVSAASNTWTVKAPPPGVPQFGRFAAVAPNAAGESVVYVFGGTDGEGGSGVSGAAYHVATNSWTYLGLSSKVSAFYTNGVGKIGNRFYFSGGFDYGSGTKAIVWATWSYDYVHDRMTRLTKPPISSADGVTGAIDGKLYVLPGVCDGDGYPNPGFCVEEPTKRFYRYDPGTDTWLARAPAPHFHRGGAAAVIGGKLYVAGGTKGPSGQDPVRTVDVYSPATNTWRTLAPLPTGGRAAGTVLQGKFFVVIASHAYLYDPATNTWTPKAAPASQPDAVVRVTLGGRVRLIAVGQGATEMYTP